MRIQNTGYIAFTDLLNLNQIPKGAYVTVMKGRISMEYEHMGAGKLRQSGTERDLKPKEAIGGFSWYAKDEVLKSVGQC